MPYRVLILGLPRSMTFWTASVLGYDHDATFWPVTDPKPGTCETAFTLLPPEKQAKYFDNETKFVRLLRPQDKVLASILRNFPEADPVAVNEALTLAAYRLDQFFKDRPHVLIPAPISPLGLFRLANYLGRDSEYRQWVEALQDRKDRLDDPAIRAQCARTFTPNTSH